MAKFVRPAAHFRLPTNQQRVAIMGRTGSGKTQFGAWLLSQAPFDIQPYVIVDYKGDDLLNSIDRAVEIGLNEVPTQPGLYIVHPENGTARGEEEVEAWLWKVKTRGRTGLYFDEAYMLPNTRGQGALSAILTQGRSLRIPVIALTQRPAFIQRFVFTEADFMSIFHLQHHKDIKTIGEFTSPEAVGERLADYHSRWYDVGQDATFVMRPVPDADTILETFHDRLAVKRKRV